MGVFVQIPTTIGKLCETQIETLDGQSSYLFLNEPFEKRPGVTIEDFGLYSETISSSIFSGTDYTSPRCLSHPVHA